MGDVDRLVDAHVDARLSGLAVGIIRGGEVEYERYAGMASVSRAVPIDGTTRFRIGSVTKTMTAVAVLQLVDDGRVGLDDEVNAHLRGAVVTPPSAARAVTIRDLLTHLSGIGEVRRAGDLVRMPYAGSFVRGGHRVPPLTEYYAKGLRTAVAPGVKWYYSNHGFALLGKIVEDVTGRSLGDHLVSRVFAPLGMTSTSLEISHRPDPQLATGYALRRGRFRPVRWIDPIVYPAGSVHSTLPDMLRYAAALCEPSAVLSARAACELHRQQWRGDPRLSGMSLGLFRDDRDGRTVLSHGGAIPGFCSHLVVVPEAGLGVVALTNTFTPMVEEIARVALRQVLPEPPAEVTTTASPAEMPGALDGTYAPMPGYATNLRAYMGFGARLRIHEHPEGLHLRGRLGPLRKGVVLRESDQTRGLYTGGMNVHGVPTPIQLAVRRDAGEEPELVLHVNSFFQLNRRRRLRR